MRRPFRESSHVGHLQDMLSAVQLCSLFALAGFALVQDKPKMLEVNKPPHPLSSSLSSIQTSDDLADSWLVFIFSVN